MSGKIQHIIQNFLKTRKERFQASVPDNLFIQCPSCKKMIYKKKIDKNHGICPDCGYHMRISNHQWTEVLFDHQSVQNLFEEYKTVDVLEFPGYKQKLDQLYEKNVNEGIATGRARIDGIPVLFGIMNTDFILGSMGSVLGERIALLFEKGTSQRLPVIILSRSGGARMQEGAVSLMQMTKTAAAAKRFSNAGNLFISLITNPTTGGVTASFAMLGDIIITEPNALIGFAGPRVIEQTIKQKLPEGFQTSEFLQEKGFVDLICERNQLKDTLHKILKIHQY
ncbi:MAG: acetyl-CoA carboxylase carboxyltransferase subunit beta [Bacteroidales bacterium]|nr:acetyl-CoA carboxylase carboxyltransferase subunit beta [Bacteroidales bacterium]